MATVTTGTKAIDFTYDSPYKKGIKLSEKVKEAKKTYVVFSRYFGCTLCKLDMVEYREAYDKFREKDAQILMVLQSPPETINEKVAEGDFPFEFVCNPSMDLYPQYELPAAASMEAMLPPEKAAIFEEKKKKMVEHRLAHGAYEGEELQLPGIFLLDDEMNVLYAHRAADILDMPSIEDMLAKL